MGPFRWKKKLIFKKVKIHSILPFSLGASKVFLGFLHLSLVLGGVCLLLLQHSLESQFVVESTPKESTEHRHHVLLLELLDTYMRYEHYYKELHGRFTYDLRNLAVFHGFSSSDLLYLEAVYEIYAVKLDDGSFSISAISKNSYEKEKNKLVEKISLNEKFRVMANFPVPSPSKTYLIKEAYRMLRQHSLGRKLVGGVSTPYLSFHQQTLYGDKHYWYADGLRGEIKGDRYAINGASSSLLGENALDTEEQFSDSFSLALRADNMGHRKVSFSQEDFYAFLEEARFAQYSYEKETGRKANSWRELDLFFRFHFEHRSKRVDNFSLEVITVDKGDTLLAVRGTMGTLLGEYFSLGEKGKLERLQYTNIFINEVQRSTDLLRGNERGFQVKELGREPALNSSDF